MRTSSDSEHYETKTDQALCDLIQKGDVSAFSVLLQRYTEMVQAIAGRYSYVPGMEQEDLAQEATLALHRAALSYQPDKKTQFKTYANRVIENQMIDLVRKYMPEKAHLPFDTTLDSSPQTPQKVKIERSLEERFEQSEKTKSYLQKAKEVLSPYEHQVFSAYLENKSYQQIADELNVPAKSVDNALQRARRKLGSNT